ncbi:MAG TPA: DUF1015 domain-containing protein [Candidatus Monoglobus merdigallinarum]|uniref:DUF1015 domain-containing protein n=1 Tax=Candidatus Monoglobus merdigallinarum TaxID=2838698 RepID=A0A9D1PQH8_9FIRM|nr:DUF1015 domain-containing protein [Candidatus Monoglobus merdigallinarum]
MSIFKPADILVPRDIDFEKWSVVACDQFTSEPEYWEKAAEIAGSSPSTLNIIFPEAYLGAGGSAERIEKINSTMREYLDSGLFEEHKNSFIYVERALSCGKVRRGLVGSIDLEEYDFSKGSSSRVRATEGTITERIPPRQRIRENAPLELPHIIMLIDDREKTVIEPLKAKKAEFLKLYDFELMLGGGHIAGYKVSREATREIIKAFEQLEDAAVIEKKYGAARGSSLVIAAGDGNHSLATAKTCWDRIKQELTPQQAETHPARYALVELENIHDSALEFEPIQRVVFDIDPPELIKSLTEYYSSASFEDNGGQRIEYTYRGEQGAVYISDPPSRLAVGTLQSFLDKYIAEHGGRIDYIHGIDVVKKLSEKPNTIGFMVAAMEKNELFETVIKDGALPRKTFSMGEAEDKRYYLECKRI